MFRSQLYGSRTVNCIHAGGENRDDITTGVIEAEIDQRAFAASDPVTLHQFDVLRPVNGVEVGQQPISIGGYAEEPLM